MLAGCVVRVLKKNNVGVVKLGNRSGPFLAYRFSLSSSIAVDPEGVIEPQATAVTDNKGYAAYGNWEAFTFVSFATNFRLKL
jgi:hypothetical protein